MVRERIKSLPKVLRKARALEEAGVHIISLVAAWALQGHYELR